MEKMKLMQPIVREQAKIIKGSYHHIKDWVMDPKGYFLIRVNREKKVLELGYCKRDNVIELIIHGENPQEVYFIAGQIGIMSRLDHAAYLGKELEKAYLALKYNLNYVQDSELNLYSSHLTP